MIGSRPSRLMDLILRRTPEEYNGWHGIDMKFHFVKFIAPYGRSKIFEGNPPSAGCTGAICIFILVLAQTGALNLRATI
jgi:hypothetical protein